MPRTRGDASLRTVLLGALVLLAPLACSTTVQPGLANAPALGANPIVDSSVHDVVANGRDACERVLGPGPLRFQIPACPGVEPPALLISRPPSEPAVVMPWVEHYHSRWACSSDEVADGNTLAGRSSSYVALGRSLSATCWPL